MLNPRKNFLIASLSLTLLVQGPLIWACKDAPTSPKITAPPPPPPPNSTPVIINSPNNVGNSGINWQRPAIPQPPISHPKPETPISHRPSIQPLNLNSANTKPASQNSNIKLPNQNIISSKSFSSQNAQLKAQNKAVTDNKQFLTSFAESSKAGAGNIIKTNPNSTIVFESNQKSFGVNSVQKNNSNTVQIASNGGLKFAKSVDSSTTIAMPLAYQAPQAYDRENIINDIKNGKTSGESHGSNIDDAAFKKIVEIFKKDALKKTWEEVSAELKSKGYELSGNIEDSFTVDLENGQKGDVKVTGSWKELYSKIQQEAQAKAKADAEKKAKAEEKKKQEQLAWEAKSPEEKAQILAEKEKQAKIGEEKKKQKQLEWEAKSPEEKAKILAEQEAKKIADAEKKAKEKAEKEKQELEKYKNEYFYSWNVNFYGEPLNNSNTDNVVSDNNQNTNNNQNTDNNQNTGNTQNTDSDNEDKEVVIVNNNEIPNINNGSVNNNETENNTNNNNQNQTAENNETTSSLNENKKDKDKQISIFNFSNLISNHNLINSNNNSSPKNNNSKFASFISFLSNLPIISSLFPKAAPIMPSITIASGSYSPLSLAYTPEISMPAFYKPLSGAPAIAQPIYYQTSSEGPIIAMPTFYKGNENTNEENPNIQTPVYYQSKEENPNTQAPVYYKGMW